jgi:hypothetical protein
MRLLVALLACCCFAQEATTIPVAVVTASQARLCKGDADVALLRFLIRVKVTNPGPSDVVFYKLRKSIAVRTVVARTREGLTNGSALYDPQGSWFGTEKDVIRSYPNKEFVKLSANDTYNLDVSTFVPVAILYR